ncbi:MAG: hypothetical protein F6J87_01115 [Spirulina sp. SIO3F2]|nr:hypothetical protein [Spirulina sp. SIO3F2]
MSVTPTAPTFPIDPDLERWFPSDRQQHYATLLMGRVGLTRRRAECFVRLWAYLVLKQQPELQGITQLERPTTAVSCTCHEAANLFYSDQERGSDRAAGMMLDKLAALGLIRKTFNGNTLEIAIAPLPELDAAPTEATVEFDLDTFNPRCDAIPVATLLATNYNWLNRNTEATPYRIAKLLRSWAQQYVTGMRVMRRRDNQHPIAFYLFYPTAPESEVHFFGFPNRGIHLGGITDIDPFVIATPGDERCQALFVRSWMIAAQYRAQVQTVLLQDAQQTMRRMLQDFPGLCDIHTLMIHPSYEEITQALGFQKTSTDSQSSISWLYLALDRFLAIEQFDR